MGITPDLLPRVFDLFTQGALGIDRSEGGLGLGLALVRSFVELHGGSVAARSDGPSRGSTFEIRLLAANAVEAVAPAVEAVSASIRAPRARVLLVDDNEDAVTLLGELLTARGHDVRVASDAVGALAIATEFLPELAIVDLGLPDIDGYELGRRLSAEISPAPYLIALTGYSQQRDRERSRDAGFREHLIKPANLKQVLGAIETGMRVQRD